MFVKCLDLGYWPFQPQGFNPRDVELPNLDASGDQEGMAAQLTAVAQGYDPVGILKPDRRNFRSRENLGSEAPRLSRRPARTIREPW